MKTKGTIHVNSIEKVPNVEHWAILEDNFYTTAETGVWAPGHGYPSTTEHFVSYVAYLDVEEFKAELTRHLSDRSPYPHKVRGIHVLPVTTETVVNVTITEKG